MGLLFSKKRHKRREKRKELLEELAPLKTCGVKNLLLLMLPSQREGAYYYY